MQKNKAIKRHPGLVDLSREHHHGLLLSWKIRAGFSKNIEPERMKKYADWFFKTQLLPHFEIEEKYVFPILGESHELVHKALAEHRRLKRLFSSDEDPVRSLSQIEEELEAHIRFEERVLFKEIQEKATPEELATVEKHHQPHAFKDNIADEFWK